MSNYINFIRRASVCLWLVTIVCFQSCGQTNEVYVDDEQIGNENRLIELRADNNRLIKNPLMGWAIYSDAYKPDMDFWGKFDALEIKKYATHLYIRWPWSALEPQKGQYAWDHDAFFSLLENGAKERGLKLAFRVYVDSRDYDTQSTPEYVRKAGAKGQIGNTNQWSPYPDDLIFQENYEAFIKAFSTQFDDPDLVDYVDGFGLGKWGEGHSMILENKDNYDQMYDWIVKLYSKAFKNTLVAINYHVEIGKQRLDWAFNEQDYILRHDAFGMGYYYITFEKAMTKSHFPNRPIIAESGWWHNGSNHWMSDDPANYTTWREVWEQTLQDALSERANTLDLRNISEATSWIQTSPDLVQRFVVEGGYRLFPAKVSVPQTIYSGKAFQIDHEWHNLAVGVCPNNVKQWGYKYKVAFALLDEVNGKVVKLLVDENADPSKWLKDKPTKYSLKTHVDDLPAGRYKIAVAIVDVKKNHKPGLNLALQGTPDENGWWSLYDIEVKR